LWDAAQGRRGDPASGRAPRRGARGGAAGLRRPLQRFRRHPLRLRGQPLLPHRPRRPRQAGDQGMTHELAKIVADSISLEGIRIVSVQTNAPRIIHSELARQRAFSFSAGSSRAVPVKRMIQQVRENPAMPARFGANQPGRQDKGGEHKAFVYRNWLPRKAWADAAMQASRAAEAFAEAGYHKQIANRLIEPFQFLPCLITATEWDNFFDLCETTMPPMRRLAVAIDKVMVASEPKLIRAGQWHLPYITNEDFNRAYLDHSDPYVQLRKISAARCARNSYLTHESKRPTIAEDLALFDKLVGSKPWHASPLEHQATPSPKPCRFPWSWRSTASELAALEANFRGWRQHRQLFERHML
jgi:hypothetical protein